MSSGGLPADVEQFIRNHIDSVEELEILLLLNEKARQTWTAAEISRQLHRQADSVAARLESLHQCGLATKNTENPPRFCYNPQSRDHPTVQSLERAYQERKDTVIRLIFETPRDHLRVFSDAFRIRRHD